MNNDITIAQNDLKELEKLRKEEQGLLNNFYFLPANYQEEKINEKITSLDDAIKELQAKVSRFKELSDTHNLDDSAVLMTLDKAVQKMEELILEREKFQKYKSINDQKENLLIAIACRLSNAKEIWYQNVFNGSLEINQSLREFIDAKCLASSKLKQPLMVALLTHDDEEIYEEITASTDALTKEQKNVIYKYIELQKRRIASNLVLSDTALINLLEANTGKNIYLQTEINSLRLDAKKRYRKLADHLCQKVYHGTKLTTCLTIRTSDKIINFFEYLASDGLLPEYQKLGSKERENLANHIRVTEKNLQEEIEREDSQDEGMVKNSPKDKEYFVLNGYINKHSLDGEEIKRFQDGGDFLRTIDDMQIASYPISTIENFIGKSFSSAKVSRDTKKQVIAALLDNLQMCYDMFTSYYMRGDKEIKSHIILTNDVRNSIEINQPLNNNNIQHLLGIPSSHNRATKRLNLPPMTMAFLGLDFQKFYPARKILEKILENKERIVEDSICGCLRGQDGILYEMLPWEKIILKTNAFIRGDFFKSTSIFTTTNPNSYMIRPDDKINTVAINSTLFSENALHQQSPSSAFYSKNKDIILKGMIAELRQETDGLRISKIKGVVTNESFIGERLRTVDNEKIKTLNKANYLLDNLDAESGGAVYGIMNENGMLSVKSLDENILLLEDLALAFGDVDKVVELSYRIIDQLKNVYGFSDGLDYDNNDTLRRKK